jgi:thioredoxin 2
MAAASLMRCPSCGATNRLPVEEIGRGKKAVCGRCKTPLVAAGPVTVSDATFAAEVERATLPVLVDMWAPWCGPCRMVAPIVDQIAADLTGRVKVVKMNVDDNPATSSRFGVRSIPTLLVFKDGREVDRIVGAQPKAAIVSRLERHASSDASTSAGGRGHS